MTETSPTLTDRLRDRIYGDDPHPYDTLEREVRRRLSPQHTLFEIGCGRTAPLLRHFLGDAERLWGIDLVDFRAEDLPKEIEIHQADAAKTGLEDSSVDLAYSRAVMEHVEDADAVFQEMYRVLRPGGSYVFLTPSLWDYASLFSMARRCSNHGACGSVQSCPLRRGSATWAVSLGHLRLEEVESVFFRGCLHLLS